MIIASQSGIYKWTINRFPQPDKVYIGQSAHIQKRKGRHINLLRLGKHSNGHFQAAFNKYGEHCFKFEVIEVCDIGSLTIREQHHVDKQVAEFGRDSLCNIFIESMTSSIGTRHSEATKAKISAAHKHRPRTAADIDGVKRAAEKRRGRPLSAEAIAKRTAKQKGRVQSVAERARHAEAAILVSRNPEILARRNAAIRIGWARRKAASLGFSTFYARGAAWPQ